MADALDGLPEHTPIRVAIQVYGEGPQWTEQVSMKNMMLDPGVRLGFF